MKERFHRRARENAENFGPIDFSGLISRDMSRDRLFAVISSVGARAAAAMSLREQVQG